MAKIIAVDTNVFLYLAHDYQKLSEKELSNLRRIKKGLEDGSIRLLLTETTLAELGWCYESFINGGLTKKDKSLKKNLLKEIDFMKKYCMTLKPKNMLDFFAKTQLLAHQYTVDCAQTPIDTEELYYSSDMKIMAEAAYAGFDLLTADKGFFHKNKYAESDIKQAEVIRKINEERGFVFEIDGQPFIPGPLSLRGVGPKLNSVRFHDDTLINDVNLSKCRG